MLFRLLSLALFSLAAALFAPSPALKTAQAEGIEAISQSIQNRFPNGLQFNIFVAARGDIAEARLQYRVLPETIQATVRATCTPGASSNCTAQVGNTEASYLVPGATVEYVWEVRDQAGGSLTTAPQTTQYMDTRFRWESKSSGRITAYSYSGSDQTIDAILQAANETASRFAALLGTVIDFDIKVWVYANPRDLQDAAAGSSARAGILEGQVVAADTALVARDEQTLDTVRHEIVHVVVRRASRGFIVPVPTWLNEGLAVYSQRALSPGWQQALDLAIRRNRPIPIESLGESTRSGTDFSLFYAQSGSIVSYLVRTYGDDKFREFFQSLRNDTLNNALRKVYGFDQFGLENQWRKSVGLPEVTTQGSGNTGGAGTLPTIVPFGAQGSGSGSTPEPAGGPQTRAPDAGGGDGNTLVIAIGALTAAAVIALLGAGVYLARKRA
ncbi:MAG TPA: peptidase MA family metallohydrolase [Dehalococcoidia bacterium]|nr:peptidase MA family metallohydrolase [Dehalococcoidia bacterium]